MPRLPGDPPSGVCVQICFPVVASSATIELFAPEDVHHFVDDERIEAEIALAIGNRMEPGELELRDVGLVDLLERRVLHRVGRAAIVAPGGVRRLRLSAQRDDDERHDRKDRHREDAAPGS